MYHVYEVRMKGTCMVHRRAVCSCLLVLFSVHQIDKTAT